MVRIIGNSSHVSRLRIFDTIHRKQKGLCRHCNEPFKPTDLIVSAGKNRKYYHIDCAARLSIIELYSSLPQLGLVAPVVVESNNDRQQLLTG
jgi:hypothetical protein